MFEYLIFRDQRLTGNLPFLTALTITYNLNATVPLRNAFNRVDTSITINGGKLHTIFILCHGYAGSNNNARMSMDAGGMGLQLGQEDVLHNNVSMWEAIKDQTENIVVYSCAASNTEAGNEGTTADGKYLMGALAIHTNATVYAADRIQWYNPDHYDFGRWEGDLWRFPANGEPGSRTSGPPVSIRDVI
ncbi:MAG: hypothetical protein IPM63_17535 [Acidobacteriota bacterium]|nr:MAG: hypothetical protein IPM63_17535 [Acidobacteriota bacterium]